MMGGLDLSPIGLLLLVVTGVVSFALGRWWSRGWRARRAAKKLTEARERETRQQRRARERSQAKRH
ncbi:MAG: hypothetical protein LCH72_00500 [Proteobacteria bacterium]|nr:hypothetical protein [Pseudomonadota bacterium]HMT57798.1 hypothetical protein [Ottowia sp.]HOM19945.1 hypothetical protein [Ottowia sp.]HON29807.1 hypothetical protein [Ottowia sp.]